ncbi:hypothetical protein SAMN05192580_0237 [Sphingomonas jatrophae]|uniref:Uncharacterized protein n=2 Tax=Sphingomonas jatrophae TaxID=1166337 RepID=A0A1I6JGA1_9SPHN|nr:hypothetical protein SAMN05192580_0237 [Sphingomonas jatrophae]
MAKPPESPSHSDLTGVNRDGRVNAPKREPDRDDAERLATANQDNRAKPPSESGTGASGD